MSDNQTHPGLVPLPPLSLLSKCQSCWTCHGPFCPAGWSFLPAAPSSSREVMGEDQTILALAVPQHPGAGISGTMAQPGVASVCWGVTSRYSQHS